MRIFCCLLLAMAAGCTLAPQRQPHTQPILSSSRDSAEAERTAYVVVHDTHPECFLLQEPEAFSDVLWPLSANQQVFVVASDWDRNHAYVRVRVTSNVGTVTGWAPRAILGARPVWTSREASERFGAEHAAVLTKSNLETPPEFDPAGGAPQIDQLESSIQQGIGGSATQPDPRLMRRVLRHFGQQGGLLPGDSD
ncbi:MAG: hypothetical protein IPK87_11745 [Planctomycetes bacterium]|nr:hypothetical protein [Planctomycetota bacterium]